MGMGWGLAQALMVLVVGCSALAVGCVMRLVGGSHMSSCIATISFGTSIVHLRLMAWWSAFVQDLPLVPLLFVGILFWSLSLRRTTWWTIFGTLLFCLLSGFAYEPGYLFPIFLLAIVALLLSSGVRPVGNLRVHYATFFCCFLICLVLFLHHKLNYAGIAPDQTFADVFRLVLTFIGASTGPLLIGLAPSTTWPSVIIGALLVLLPFLIGIIVLRRKGALIALAWAGPYFALAGALAYARAGFDSKSGVPGYPRDYQYHGLSTAWTILCIVLLIERLSQSDYRIRYLRFASLLLLLPNVIIPSQALLASRIAMNSNENIVSRQYAETLQGVPDGDKYFIDRHVPVVLEQFGGYARLFSAREVFSDTSTPVLSGRNPIWIDDQGQTHQVAIDRVLKSTVLEAVSTQRCVQPSENWARVSFDPTEPWSIVHIEIEIMSTAKKLEIFALLGTGESQIVWSLGYIQRGDSSLAFEVPNTYSNRTSASSLPLTAIQIVGLSPESSICFGNASVMRVVP